jgi:methyltransferase-like protein
VVEIFDDSALALRLDNRSLVELNSSAGYILTQTDGQHTLEEIAHILEKEYAITFEEAFQDVANLYDQLIVQGIVEPVISH